jgi:hypothetical protein
VEQPCDEGALSPDVTSADLPNLSLSDHRHRLNAGQRSSGRPQTAKTETGADQALSHGI